MMRTSPTLAALAPALVKARAEVKVYAKSRTAKVQSPKGNYTYEYATLADAFEAVTDTYSAHGLVLLHFIDEQNAREITVGARLLHESGEWVEDVLRFTIPDGSGPQQLGSLLTYARRYTTLNLAGLAATDDDGKSAQDASDRAHQQRRQESPREDTGEVASDKQKGMLKGLIQRQGDEKAKAWLASGELEHVTRQMASKMIDRLMNGEKTRTTTTPLVAGDPYASDGDSYEPEPEEVG